MLFGSIISSPRASLSLQQALDLTNVYLDNARNATDLNVALVLCHDAEVALSQVKRAAKHTDNKAIRDGIATVYSGLIELLKSRGYRTEARAFLKKSEKWGALLSAADIPSDKPSPRPSLLSLPGTDQGTEQGTDITIAPQKLFPKDVYLPAVSFNPPEPDSRLESTRQLAYCLGLLQLSCEFDEILDPIACKWLQTTKDEPDEPDRLKALATDVIRAFKSDELKDAKSVTEVVYLANVLNKGDFRYLLKEFYSGVDQSGLLDVHQLEGIAHLVRGAHPENLDIDDLIKILELLSTRLRNTHQQSTSYTYELTLAVSHVLDAMVDAKVQDLDREKIHEPLSSYLNELKDSPDAYLVYQAAYAYQALACVPDDESLWQGALRRTGKVVLGVSGLVSAVKGLDLDKFISGLENIQQGLKGVSEMVDAIKGAYDKATSLIESGRGFYECLKEGFSIERKFAWYSALRGADTLIREGQFGKFRKLACEAPCRRDAAFQWGVCQRLGEVAANSMWESETRQSAIEFLGEMYRNDKVWGEQEHVKQWILSILMQLSSGSSNEMQCAASVAERLLQELGKDESPTKQSSYQMRLKNGFGNHPLKVALHPTGSLLLDRVQQRPDVDKPLRQLRRQRLKNRGNVVYIPPQAKDSLHAHEDAEFPLLEKVDKFLAGKQCVFLLLGDSGAGKSTFNRELEYYLWDLYKKNCPIPLHINLPTIERPEHDMIAKQLRKCEFTEPQIRELKRHRTFTLICDGYDESQQTHNLYTSNRLNQPGEWSAKMVISCRSEYLGVDYRDRFQPGDRNHPSETMLLQEAVIAPFSTNQVQEYITQYVSLHKPLWEVDQYKEALELIPSLTELVKNPFLMSLSLDVLPRIVDLGNDLSATRVTRMALYDQFIEHWLERGKKRLGEKNLNPQARAAYESLTDEGFTQNGIDYLKKLSAAIYREQAGQPVVSYSRYKDENTWKSEFFCREEEKQLLREACPLIRNGNQHRFIHRSLLEYGISLAIFDPQDWKRQKKQDRRRSVSSITSLNERVPVDEPSIAELGPESPLACRSFVKEPSVLQFLEERVQQEPLFKQQLLDYIEHSKKDDKWRIAASNAITILVRAGVQFNSTDLRGIRVPNADLSYGMFESAQLQGADLKQVNLRGAWMQKANLSEAQMEGVQFGELPFLKQESAVGVCVYSPDEKTIAVGLDNGNINVYSTSNWEILVTLKGHNGRVLSVMYSPNGNQAASSSEDRTVMIWNVREGARIHVINGDYGWTRSVSYSPQGDQVASASDDGTVKLWDASTGDCRHIWIGHTSFVLGAIYSPNGTMIASNSYDRTVRLWDVEEGTCVHALLGHDGSVESIVYSPQGDQIASASADKTVRLWDTKTGSCRHIFTGHSNFVSSVVFSPKGDQVASASDDMSVRLWDVDTGVCRHILLGHNKPVSRVLYSPQGSLVASFSHDKTVRLWETETGLCRQTLTGHSNYVSSVVFSPKGDQVAAGSADMTVRLWDVGAGTSRQVGHTRTVYCVAYSPQGDRIATGSGDSTIRLWNVETGACIHSVIGHSREITSIVYSPQGDQLASSSHDRTVRLWNAGSGECHYTLAGHTGPVSRVTYLPDGSQLISCSWDKSIRMWDAKTGVCNFTLTGHSSYVYDIALSPLGDQIASTSYDTTVRVWSVKTGECHHIFIGHNTFVLSVIYSLSGNQIISSGWDGLMKVWDVQAMARPRTLSGHTERVNRIVYSSQGDLVVSASNDKSVRLWDVMAGQCRAAIQDFQGSVYDIAWIESPAVNCLMAGSSDGVVRMWQVKADGDQYHVSLLWRTTKGELSVMDAAIHDVEGLSQLNRQLLKQRGAVEGSAHQ
ncbi:MAG: WD40-repeat-containing domain protein [Benniella sp.]|nr:MAG: WD40-repeat-containing domain protein [Benniella sp.]